MDIDKRACLGRRCRRQVRLQVLEFLADRRDRLIESQDLVIDALRINLKMRYFVLGRIEHQGAADRNSPSDTGSAQSKRYSSSPKRSLMSWEISSAASFASMPSALRMSLDP